MNKIYRSPLLLSLESVIKYAVNVLAVLMTVVIVFGVVDVARLLVTKLLAHNFLLSGVDLLSLFGAFMAVLIAIEIFINIIVYLREEVIHVKIVLATALVAVARKVIVFDYTVIDPAYVWATAGVIVALSIGYWLTGVRIPGLSAVQSNSDDTRNGGSEGGEASVNE